jgi:hypothetical protein
MVSLAKSSIFFSPTLMFLPERKFVKPFTSPLKPYQINILDSQPWWELTGVTVLSIL